MNNRTNEEFRIKRVHEVCFKDLTGMTFGNLKVIGVSHKVKKTWYWHCICNCEKQTHVTVAGGALTSGHTKSCGCSKKGCQIKDISGQKFGTLTAIENVGVKDRKALWKCRCDCGNEIVVFAAYLKSGSKKTCPKCSHILRSKSASLRHKDITNQKFNHLTALKYLGKSLWECECDCKEKNHKNVKYADLTRGFVQSCGCVSVNKYGSTQENEIKSYILSFLPNATIIKCNILDRKEIDIYLPEYKFGIEFNGSVYHATENGLRDNKDKYYHRDKFLAARNQGIHLITIFDIDYNKNKPKFLNLIKDVLLNIEKHDIPTNDIIYTDNDIDDGKWLQEFGYIEDCQIEPESYTIRKNIKVYRCGKTKWILQPNTEVTQ